MHILMTALTDFETKKHHYAQKPIFFGKNVTITSDRVGLNDVAEMKFSGQELKLGMKGSDYSLSLEMNAVKPPVWHCDNGVLKMGVNDPRETTYYWSYANLATSGKLTLGNKEYKVAGKAWFDKQGGTYTLTGRWTNWEWFSLRFFDGEEVMLFSFPQDDYQDGTYIEKSGKFRRLNDYQITPHFTLSHRVSAPLEFSTRRLAWKILGSNPALRRHASSNPNHLSRTSRRVQ